ncbi:MAG: FAD:protein FMN transferase [Proteobacteria bacterium]|nr:FAD:protein FMN transferase [Pseudomonadota bacterium]MBU1584736.1 FAD:protein FMN transferase [Pseudomonadota bacterium]MBU2454430.1 FAD:protein FMN transferase [Pseudomonadota bacterium]MBU2628809.1 FAD:protein FMN transferase [Pseudomonadota bacterium]
MKLKKIIIFYFFFSFFIFHSTPTAASNFGRQYTISGKTMGTFYTVKFISTQKQSPSFWENKVDTRLREINNKLSMYNPKSELSLFNAYEIGTPVTISSDFFIVMKAAKTLYQITDGSWDGTVKPLVDLWGFGTKKETSHVPGLDKIATALSKTGFNHIEIKEPHTILKNKAVTLDLGSIAKGYGVDAVASIFLSSGIHDVLVEIGGELYASGKNKKGEDWSVGISRPDKQFANQALYKIIRLNNQAIATSGNYRNFFEIQGKTFSHIIDPKTGFPVDNTIVSASVISKDCTFADGLATALMVMDVQKAIELVNRLENTECLIIEKKGQQFVHHSSKNFEAFVVK